MSVSHGKGRGGIYPQLSTSPGQKEGQLRSRDFESKRGSFQEIGAKWSKFSKFRAKIALLEALSCRKMAEKRWESHKFSIKKRV